MNEDMKGLNFEDAINYIHDELGKAYAVNHQKDTQFDNPTNFDALEKQKNKYKNKNKQQIDTRILDKISILKRENDFLREKAWKLGKDIEAIKKKLKDEQEKKEKAYREIYDLNQQVEELQGMLDNMQNKGNTSNILGG